MKSRIALGALLVTATVSLSSCGGGGNKTVYSATGWPVNSSEAGGFEANLSTTQYVLPGMSFIEGGTFVMGRVLDDPMSDNNNLPKRATVASFFMDETEVTNISYREYLFWLERVYNESYPEVLRNALPDENVWRSKLGFNEPMVETYLRHPGFNYYPVVGVSWKQAMDYCSWRTDRVNEYTLVQAKALKWNADQYDDDNFNTKSYLAGKYIGEQDNGFRDLRNPDSKDGRAGRMEDGVITPGYRLPTEAEWEYAALGLKGNSIEGNIDNGKYFPRGGIGSSIRGLRSNLTQNAGVFLANFKRGRGDNMGTAGYLNDYGARTSEVKTYPPNDFGLYDMAGNVSEWVLDVYRDNTEGYDDFNPFRGNVFTKMSRDEDGFLPDVDSLGRLPMELVTNAENIERRNYTSANNISFKDGDMQSSIYYQKGTTQGDSPMYDEGASLINDRTRVYKGGSWKDRQHWLTPGTRRFLDENLATDDIGFRCVIDRMGSQGIKRF